MSNTIFNHKQLIASLSDDVRSELTQKCDKAGLLNLATHAIALTVTSVWIANGFAGWQLVLLIQGIMLVFLFTLQHETSHFTAFNSAYLNKLVGWVCGILLCMPPNWFRFFHLAHHRHTHDPKHDPELAGSSNNSPAQFVWTVSGIPIWRFQIGILFKNAFGNPDYEYVPTSAIQKIKREARLIIVLYAAVFAISLAASSLILIWLWLLPVLLGQPFLRLYLMAEHGRCPHVANMLENTRTTYTNRLVRWLAWNMPYHAEHHAYPSVPFHQLPKFHEVAKEHLQITENGYIQFQSGTIQALKNAKHNAGEQA